MDYESKYIKYKSKYIDLCRNIMSGGKKIKKNSRQKMIIEPKYIENLSEPWFTLIVLGLKTVEGRKNKGRFKEMQIGDIVEWKNNDFNERRVLTRITGKAEYATFEEYLLSEGLDKCLPGISSIEDGLSVYFKYFTKEDESAYGVVAIRLELIN